VRSLLVVVAGLALVLASPVPASAASRPKLPLVGFGEQSPKVFSNPHWTALGLKPMRLVVGWDALRYRWQRNEIDAWMTGARAVGARPLIAFTRSRAHWRNRVVPSARTYVREFREFRRRYPEVRDYLIWNEANHGSQPVHRRPERVAEYYDAVVRACPRCNVVGADVLDSSNMVAWVTAFRRAAKHRPKIWGLHNYIDANRLRSTGTRQLLKLVKGQIWFTETGGLVRRKKSSPIRFPQSSRHAGKVTRYVLYRLANLSPRVKRIYFYHFENPGRDFPWDSGVMTVHDKPRPAYHVIARWAAEAEKARRAERRAAERRQASARAR
jgi:hypothetical protein